MGAASFRRSSPRLLFPFAGLLLLAAGLLRPAVACAQVPDSSLGIGASLSGGSLFSMPQATFLAELALPLSGSHIDVSPQIGVSYLFLPMTGISGSLFIPVGAKISFDDYGIALFALNEVDVLHPLDDGIISFGIEGFIDFPVAGRHSIRLGLKTGMGIVWSTSVRPSYLIALAPSVGFIYRLPGAHPKTGG